MTALRLRGVSKRYGPTAAVHQLDLDVPAGSRTAVVGPSGSGKTTLLRLIAGFEAPDEGSITLGGEVLAEGQAMVPAHRRGIGIVAQEGALFPHLSVAENVGFGLEKDLTRPARVAELMEMVELPQSMAEKRPHQLSGGQQQRVALARALARRPKLMLLDEPFSALDTGLRHTMRRMTAEVLRAAEMPVILVTHDQGEAMSFADQVAVLHDGRLAQVGAPRDLYLKPADPWTAAFLGEAVLLSGIAHDGFVDTALGSVPADTAGRTGPVQVMLRPEQLRLRPAPGGVAASGHVLGRVAEVEFEGGHCTVAVDIDCSGRSGIPSGSGALRLRIASADVPAVGAAVQLEVTGPAHVF